MEATAYAPHVPDAGHARRTWAHAPAAPDPRLARVDALLAAWEAYDHRPAASDAAAEPSAAPPARPGLTRESLRELRAALLNDAQAYAPAGAPRPVA